MLFVILFDPANQRAILIDETQVRDFIEMPAHRITTIQPRCFLASIHMPTTLPAAIARKGFSENLGCLCHALNASCWMLTHFCKRSLASLSVSLKPSRNLSTWVLS